MLCARCGFERREHSYNGACYGLCGEFIEPDRSANMTKPFHVYAECPDGRQVSLGEFSTPQEANRFALGVTADFRVSAMPAPASVTKEAEMLALADQYEIGLKKMEASDGYEEFQQPIINHCLVIEALRAAARPAPAAGVIDREAVRAAVVDGWSEGCMTYEKYDATMRLRFDSVADAILALKPTLAGEPRDRRKDTVMGTFGDNSPSSKVERIGPPGWLGSAREQRAFLAGAASTPVTATTAGEPVAWQVWHAIDGWSNCSPFDVEYYENQGIKTRPLYACPAPSGRDPATIEDQK